MEINEFVTKLVESGFTEEKATLKVKKIIEKIKEKKGEQITDVEITALLNAAITSATANKGERYKGLCIGYEGKYDQNAKIGQLALDKYNNAATKAQAIKDGFVKEMIGDDGSVAVVPIDMRKFIDKDNKYENRGYGQPLRSRMIRKCYFIVDGEMTIVSGNIDPALGTEYYIYGKKKGMYINTNRNGIQKAGTLDKSPLWDAVTKFAETSDFAVNIGDVPSLDIWSIKLTKGFIKNGGDTKTGGRWGVIHGDELPAGVFGFTTNEDTAAILSESDTGNEVYVLLKIKPPREGSDGVQAAFLGVIINPESTVNNELLSEIDSFITED
jgi:hypothetical protein